ncbi:MAG: hypothetical protein UT30_C0014G0007 [Candidatus Uhrbacteria bacterium GW2011_GWF2_39_13]|uniref:Uncharacterized protein n=1 Tax=Candidatus Uhrbacteria bacterium GW2011_GWF2_39_13 TaxID=1618995 RepID=A0A0G0MIW8_9BACT|nr:MAG: hypothetical protein UT30_C0014G0007 [Candidatus Uhrbacteria bacterium GW2011_GWF2_39_13]
MAGQLDVCLVNSPLRAASTIIPQSLLWLAGWVEAKGYSAEIVDIKRSALTELNDKKREDVFRETVERTVAYNARVVGLTCCTGEFSTITKLAREIRNRCDAKIIVGGVHTSVSPDDYFTIKDSPFDAVVIGEGEEILTEILEYERKGESDWQTISGLVIRKNGEIIHTRSRVFCDNLDQMPLPVYHKLNMDHYLKPQLFLLRYVFCSGVHIFTSQGCPYQCTFCANRLRKVRYRELDDVIEEIIFLKKKYDIDFFYIQDDTFTIKPKRVIEFCQRLKALNLGIIWGIEGRVNQFPDEVFNALVEAGCIQMDFGVESGSQKMLDRMKKGIAVEDIKRIFKLCRSNHIRTFANFLLNTPGETEEDVQKTVELSEEIKASAYAHAVTIPYPGTAIYEEYVKPPLTIEEYDLLLLAQQRYRIVDGRFRIAAHSLDIERLALKLNLRFTFFQRLLFFSFNPKYLKVLLHSSRKPQYLYMATAYSFRNIIYYTKALAKRSKSIIAHYFRKTQLN